MTESDRARIKAVRILKDVLESGAYANLSAIRLLADDTLDSRDRAFASALVYGTISRLPALDYLLGRVLRRPLASLDPDTRTILRLGAWQLLYAVKVPPHAAVDSSVRLARQLTNPGAASLVNACLRRLASADRPELPAGNLALAYGLSNELFGCLKKWYGLEEARAIAADALEARPQTTIRVNQLKTTPVRLLAQLRAEHFAAGPGHYCPEALDLDLAGHSVAALPAYQEGLFTVQDEAAMLVAAAADPKPGWRVIDLCAAPGGKATHLAERMQDQGQIFALDISPSRLSLITAHARRLGLTSVRTAVADATAPEWPAGLPETAELVLADVPCSGLGLLGRKPEIRLTMTYARMSELVRLQAAILRRAAALVAPGGVLIYSTCTINPDENIRQIHTFLQSPEGQALVLEDLTPFLPVALLAHQDLQAAAKLGYIQLLPHRHQTDGFFIARMRRQSHAALS
jgi:16S rRNA (cytosine967-C5)-methyltransferase